MERIPQNPRRYPVWQVDFLSKLVVTPKGLKQVFAMAFLHVGPRRVFVTPSTLKPDAAWMQGQAHAFLKQVGEQQLGGEILMRDRDGKYSRPFDQIFRDRQIQVKPVGPRAPNLCAFVERWIQSLEHEALNHFIVFGLEHFDYIVRDFVSYYHECRPHQGIGNRLIGTEEAEAVVPVITSLDQLHCESRLGGILKSYNRAA